MPSRQQLGEVLLGCLDEVAALLRHAHSVAVEEQNALVANDAEALVRTCKAQEEVLYRISEADQRAADAATQLAELAGMDPENAEAAAIAEAAGAPYNDLIGEQMALIPVLADKVRQANEINHRLLENGLDIVACCLRTLANDPGPNAYSQKAELSGPQAYVLSLDRRA